MHLLTNTNNASFPEKYEFLTEPDALLSCLNNALDKAAVPYVVNEHQIEVWLNELEMQNNQKNPGYWLLLVRLFELALLCAGNYADNCEFSAAGDLLLNPRRILVHFKNARQPVLKQRHGKLSEQFGRKGQSRKCALQRLADHATIETKRQPLLPHLFKIMQNSGRVSASYLDLAGTRMKRIAETIGFLSSWQISDAAELYRRTTEAGPEASDFIQSNLCRFRNDLFFAIGDDVRQAMSNPLYRSDFLVYISFVFPDENVAHGSCNMAAQV